MAFSLKGALIVALVLLSGCAAKQTEDAAAPSACELSQADLMDAAQGEPVHLMTGPEFSAWSTYAKGHGVLMQPGMSAYVFPGKNADDRAVVIAYQGCIVLTVTGFSSNDIERMFKGENIDGDAAPGGEGI